ncbi:hypothetical protein HanRHA438_Chr05g0227411 [Helianthus annuus]|nr:hypothetical protein HanRHA438_Chr05g0227411 [Helianthus annuus]
MIFIAARSAGLADRLANVTESAKKKTLSDVSKISSSKTQIKHISRILRMSRSNPYAYFFLKHPTQCPISQNKCRLP